MTLVIERKNTPPLHLPRPQQSAGRAITLVFLQSVAVLIALWYALTGGGKRFRRLAQRGGYERDLLEAVIGIHWRNGRFVGDDPFTAIRRLFHLVIVVAFHAELRGRHGADIARQRRAACAVALCCDGLPAPVTPHDTS